MGIEYLDLLTNQDIAFIPIMNQMTQPPTLYVYGGMITYRVDDKIKISKHIPGPVPGTIVLKLEIIDGNMPKKGTFSKFVFENQEEYHYDIKWVTITDFDKIDKTVDVVVIG